MKGVGLGGIESSSAAGGEDIRSRDRLNCLFIDSRPFFSCSEVNKQHFSRGHFHNLYLFVDYGGGGKEEQQSFERQSNPAVGMEFQLQVARQSDSQSAITFDRVCFSSSSVLWKF